MLDWLRGLFGRRRVRVTLEMDIEARRAEAAIDFPASATPGEIATAMSLLPSGRMNADLAMAARARGARGAEAASLFEERFARRAGPVVPADRVFSPDQGD